MVVLAFYKQEFPFQWAFGLPFLAGAIAMAAQTYYTSKRGYVYCGRSKTVEKKKHPGRYRFHLGVQIGLILVLVGFSTFPFWL